MEVEALREYGNWRRRCRMRQRRYTETWIRKANNDSRAVRRIEWS
jgi:hypothetical protein